MKRAKILLSAMVSTALAGLSPGTIETERICFDSQDYWIERERREDGEGRKKDVWGDENVEGLAQDLDEPIKKKPHPGNLAT